MKLETHGCQSIGSANEKLSASKIQDLPITFSWIGLIILPLLQKPSQRKLEPWFVVGSLSHLKLYFIYKSPPNPTLMIRFPVNIVMGKKSIKPFGEQFLDFQTTEMTAIWSLIPIWYRIFLKKQINFSLTEM